MLDRREINMEIARLEYEESSYPNYAKLADLYTIRDRMDREEEQTVENSAKSIQYDVGYSSAPAQNTPAAVGWYGDSDFLQTLEGKDASSAWAIMDDLMDTLHTVNPRVYDGVMRKIRAL